LNLDFGFLTVEVLRSYVLNGLLFSLQLTAVAMVGGIALGTLLAVFRLSGKPWLALPAAAYVNTLRSIPLVMVILWFFLLIPFLIGRPLGAELSAVVTFTLFEAAYYSEIMRAGIQSIPQGQTSAAYAMGMGQVQTLRLVVLPQALRNMLPVLLTQTIILFQDTSLVYAIGAYDLLKGFESVGRNFNRPVETYLVAAASYFSISLSLSLWVRRIQRRVAVVR
jgi:glutamate/aspartate transport system permease protein